MPQYIALLSEQTERSSVRPQFQYGILELELIQFRVLGVPVRFLKGAPWVIGHRLSAPTRRLPVGVSDPSPRALVWLMSGVRPDLAQLYPTRLYSTAVWHSLPTFGPNTLSPTDDHVGEDMETTKTFLKP